MINEPTEGFVINRNGGGHGRGWDSRQAFIRIWDPRDFEFEISVANLLFILREADCSKGKGLEGKFVYSWEGTELVLLPASSSDYNNSLHFTDLQGKKVKAKELVPGYSYSTRRQEVLTYVGKYNFKDWEFSEYYQRFHTPKKRFIFWDSNGNNYVYLDNVSSLAEIKSDSVPENIAELIQNYIDGPHSSPIKKLFLEDGTYTPKYGNNKYWAAKKNNKFFVLHDYGSYPTQYQNRVYLSYTYELKDGFLHKDGRGGDIYLPEHVAEEQKKWEDKYGEEFKKRQTQWPRYGPHHYGYSPGTYDNFIPRQPKDIMKCEHFVPFNNKVLMIELESGQKIRVGDYYYG